MRPSPRVAAVLLTLLLSACGGGGGGDSSGGGSTPTPTPTATPPVLTGVVSVGAPVGGASISVVDAKGTALGSASANAVDGSYRLTLSAASPSLPLLLQARGVDAAGLPVLLHTLVPAAANDASTTAHLTPLTQALSALVLGADPQPAFAKPADAKLTEAAALLTGGATFLKALIKTPLTDAKIAGIDKFDVLSDSGFATAKSGPDLLLETLRLQIDPASGKLHLGNKFLLNPTPEVELSLATARAELVKGASGAAAAAITSTLKVTSAANTVLPLAATLDGIVSTLNPVLAKAGATAADFAGLTALATAYTSHDGRSAAELHQQLADWSALGLQLGALQILGCADETVKKGDCARVLVASTLTDRSGKPLDHLLDTATYNTTAKRWELIGNGKPLGFEVLPASGLRLDASGKAESDLPNPVSGVELRLQSKVGTADTFVISTATVQTSLGFALPLADCEQRLLCIAPAGAISVVPQGAPRDQFLYAGAVGWLGGADALRGALYKAQYTRAGLATETQRAHLPAAVIASPLAERHPTLDGVSASSALTVAALGQGLKLTWSTWARAQPDLRLIEVRAVIRYADRIVQRSVLALPGRTDAELDPTAAVGGLTPLGHDLWLVAVDGAGRRLYTRYALGV